MDELLPFCLLQILFMAFVDSFSFVAWPPNGTELSGGVIGKARNNQSILRRQDHTGFASR
jgi:hypothetical protein